MAIAARTLPTQRAGAGESDAELDLSTALRQSFLAGRLALFVAELLSIILRFERIEAFLPAVIALWGLIAYNIAGLLALRLLRSQAVPAGVFIGADLVVVGGLAASTGWVNSPFTGLFYLIILSGAVYYGLAGGLTTAALAVVLLISGSLLTPELREAMLQGEARTQLIPYLCLAGGFAGYLVRQLKQLHERRVEFEAELRRREFEDKLQSRDFAVAREVQRAALRDPPHHPALEIAVHFEPARVVGGDFYAFLPGGSRMGILIGDICGKGIAAALLSTSICHLTRWTRPMHDPAEFLARLNQNLDEQAPEGHFATAAFLLLDPEREHVDSYNAGHPPVLLLSDGGVRPISARHPPLGVLPDVRFDGERAPFRQGDLLLAYTDGCIEVRNPAGEELGTHGLTALLCRLAGLPVPLLISRLIEEIRAFGEVRDDLALVAVRHRSPER